MFRIQVTDPNLLDDLRQALSRANCPAVPLSDDTLLVTHPLAYDELEARVELAFFLRAWQARQPSGEVELREFEPPGLAAGM